MFSRTKKQSVQFDMHTHSDRSRESKIPGRLLLSLAKHNGLQGLGICEQDAFPDETLYAYAAKLRLRLALGIEFTCKDANIIGFGMDFSSKEKCALEARFADIRQQVTHNTTRFIERLKSWDSTVSLERVAAFAAKEPHPTFVLQYLVHGRRMFPSMAAARQFIAEERLDLGLTNTSSRHPAEAIEIIHRAGGIAIWAHPFLTPGGKQQSLMDALIDVGLDGVEAVYPYREHGYMGDESNEVLQARTLSLTKKSDVFLSGGSDCKYPISPLEGMRPMLPGEYGITSQEAECFDRVFQ